MRRKTKWVFALLAFVFALTFVFLGVGSGGSALTDILNGNIHLFGSGGGPSIQSLQSKVQKNPTDPKARLDLAKAYVTKNQTANAIAAYKAYLKLRPGATGALNELGSLYSTRLQEIKAEIQSPPISSTRRPAGSSASTSASTGSWPPRPRATRAHSSRSRRWREPTATPPPRSRSTGSS